MDEFENDARGEYEGPEPPGDLCSKIIERVGSEKRRRTAMRVTGYGMLIGGSVLLIVITYRLIVR